MEPILGYLGGANGARCPYLQTRMETALNVKTYRIQPIASRFRHFGYFQYIIKCRYSFPYSSTELSAIA